MKEKHTQKELTDFLELLEPAVLEYVMNLLKRANFNLDKNQAENLIANMGMNIQLRKLRAEANPTLN